MKKLLALTLCAVMLLGMIPMAGAASFSDSKAVTRTADEAVDVMSDLKIITGFPDGTFKPEETLTRAQAAKIIACVALGTEAAEALAGGGTTFSDVPASHWANKYVEYCASKSIVAGVGNGTFNPDGKLTGYAFGKMLLVTLGADGSTLTGAEWEKNTGAQMMARHLEYGVAVSSKELSRQDACRLALNALFDGEKDGPENTLASKVFGVTRATAEGKKNLADFCAPVATYTSASEDQYWKGATKKLSCSPVHVRQTGTIKAGDICKIFGVDSFSCAEQLKVYRNGNGGKLSSIGEIFQSGNTKTYPNSGDGMRLEFYYNADRDKYVILHKFYFAEPIKSVSPATLAADGSVIIDGSVTFESGLSCVSSDFTEEDVGKYALYYATGNKTMNVPTQIHEVVKGTIVTGTLTEYNAKSALAIDGKSYKFCRNLGTASVAKKYLENGGAIGDLVNILITPDGFVAAVWQ